MEHLFRTVMPVKKSPAMISHRTALLCIGSCFARHIGMRLETNRFPVTCNPTGILFNPLSIEITLRRLLENRRFGKEDLVFRDDCWHGFEHHSDFSGSDRDLVLASMNESFDRAAEAFCRADVLMLTFGTAAVYRHVQTDRVVANCHKMPHTEFERRLVPSAEIAGLYKKLFADLLARRPELRIVLTVSPVRHLRDDPHENSVSKARLIDAVFELESQFKQVSYFPAWEIMMDDLRDYRFYDEDMVHPNIVATEYIWERFYESAIADRSREFIREFEPVVKAMQHRIQDKDSSTARSFMARHREFVAVLKDRYPEIDLTPAMEYFSRSGS
jgi:hypothetical protein